MIDEIVGEAVGNLVGQLVVGSVSSSRRAWRAVRRRSRGGGDPHRMPCAVRVIEGVHDGIGGRWRRTSAALAPGRIDLEEVELGVRRIEEAAFGRHRLPFEEAAHFPRAYMWVLRVSTDHAVVEWAIPQTDLEWAVPLVTGRVTTTVQDRPLGGG